MATVNPTRTPSGFLTFVAGIAGLVIFALLIVWWIKANGPRDTIESKRAQARANTRDEIAKRDSERLEQIGWADKAKGIARVPISDAMQMTVAELKAKKPAASQVKVEPAPPAFVPDPSSTEPPPLALPSAPAGAHTIRFDAPLVINVAQASSTPAVAPATLPAVVAPTATFAATTPPSAPVTPPTPEPAPIAVTVQPVQGPAATPAPTSAGNADLYAAGKTQYTAVCLACHQPTGMGLPAVFPPLVRSEYITGDPKRLVGIVLKGVMGPITVEGKLYNNVMPPQEAMLDDLKIAAVTTFVRKEFGPDVSPITPELVAQVRKDLTDKKAPYTEAELKSFGGSAPPVQSAAPPAATAPSTTASAEAAPSEATSSKPIAPASEPVPSAVETPAPQPAPTIPVEPAPQPAPQTPVPAAQ